MNNIQDFDDLKRLRICKICKCVYLPDYKEDITSYPVEEYPINDDICLRCGELKGENGK